MQFTQALSLLFLAGSDFAAAVPAEHMVAMEELLPRCSTETIEKRAILKGVCYPNTSSGITTEFINRSVMLGHSSAMVAGDMGKLATLIGWAIE